MPPSDNDTNDSWIIYHDNLQTIICGLSEWAVHKNTKHRQTDNWWTPVLTENLCATLWCHNHNTSHGTNTLYCTTNILVWVGRRAGSVETWTFFWVSRQLNGGCMQPGHWALHYYWTSASTSNEDRGEMCLHGEKEFALNKIVRF